MMSIIVGKQPYSIDEIAGVYINNYNKNTEYAGMPSRIDTLYLSNDSTYRSGHYGKGRYEIDSFNGRYTLDLRHENDNGTLGPIDDSFPISKKNYLAIIQN